MIKIDPELEKIILGIPNTIVKEGLLEYFKNFRRVRLLSKRFLLRFYLIGKKKIREKVSYFNTAEEAMEKSFQLFHKAESKGKKCQYLIIDRDTDKTVIKY